MNSAARKAERQSAILELIRRQRIGTQAELVEALAEQGIEVDQATVSRDVKELGLVKAVGDGGHAHYATVDDIAPATRAPRASLIRQYVRSIDASGNLIVVKGDPGMGSAIGQLLDHLGIEEIIGTVAGDDTVLAVVKEGVSSAKVAEFLRREIGYE